MIVLVAPIRGDEFLRHILIRSVRPDTDVPRFAGARFTPEGALGNPTQELYLLRKPAR